MLSAKLHISLYVCPALAATAFNALVLAFGCYRDSSQDHSYACRIVGDNSPEWLTVALLGIYSANIIWALVVGVFYVLGSFGGKTFRTTYLVYLTIGNTFLGVGTGALMSIATHLWRQYADGSPSKLIPEVSGPIVSAMFAIGWMTT